MTYVEKYASIIMVLNIIMYIETISTLIDYFLDKLHTFIPNLILIWILS